MEIILSTIKIQDFFISTNTEGVEYDNFMHMIYDHRYKATVYSQDTNTDGIAMTTIGQTLCSNWT